jgi:hypothetical protein
VAQKLLTMSANSLEVMPRASSVSCNLELKTISDCLVWSISLRPLQSLPLAKRFEAFISSWHNSVRHRAACSSVNLTSPSIFGSSFREGQSVPGCNLLTPDRFHRSGPQSGCTKLALAAVICHAPFPRCRSNAGPSRGSDCPRRFPPVSRLDFAQIFRRAERPFCRCLLLLFLVSKGSSSRYKSTRRDLALLGIGR